MAQSGNRTNVVPEDGELSVDVRVWTPQESERVEAAIRGYRPGESRESRSRSRADSIGRRSRRRRSRKRCSSARAKRPRALGLELRAARVGGASDGNLTAAAGVPTLDGLGPRGGGAHARHEFVRLTDLPRRAALVAALVASASAR